MSQPTNSLNLIFDPTTGNIGLPYLLAFEDRTGNIDDDIATILDLLYNLTRFETGTGNKPAGLLTFLPETNDGETIDLIAAPGEDQITVGKRITNNYATAGDHAEFTRWVTEYLRVAQELELTGTLELTIYEQREGYLQTLLTHMSWVVTGNQLVFVKSHLA